MNHCDTPKARAVTRAALSERVHPAWGKARFRKHQHCDSNRLSIVNGKKATMHVDGDTVKINDATIIASVRASNGMLHVVDTVLLPPED